MKQEERILICQNCNYSKNEYFITWCGTPILGDRILHNDKKIKLCGCNMNIKSKFTKSKCPANKWT